VWLTTLLHILLKVTQAQHIFVTGTGSPAITVSFWTVTDCEPGLSSKYDDVPLTLFSQSCEKFTDTIKHIDTTELLIIHFKWYGIIAQSAALFTHTLMYTIHTLYPPAVAVNGTS